ncbi:MAG: ParB/RepB/Spo0J family partition protein [Deltaproteobacteria bacterium]|nr:ParB/RepB/Spo0J family partition protein [Deltaproteobacteria bacterium]
MSLQQIPIKKIRITENCRTNIGSTHLDELMQSIKQHGVMQPIGVVCAGKGKYKLRFGQRRVLACEKLGYKTIPAIVEKSIDEEKMLLQNLTENMQRQNPTFPELGRVIDKLRRLGLVNKEIAARLGIPKNKIQEIMSVYDVLPEKYKKKVVFVEKGQRRKAGTVPALVANKLVVMKKQHGLKDKELDELFESTSESCMDRKDLDSVGRLIGSGMNVKQALANMREYGTFACDVVLKHVDISDAMEKYGLINKQHLFKKIFYGELPPFKKPDFVFTGIFCHEDGTRKDNKVDVIPYKKMLAEIIERIRKKKLTENQEAAIKSIRSLTSSEWLEVHCKQIKDIHKATNKEK